MEALGYIAFMIAVVSVLYLVFYIVKTVDEDTKRITGEKG